MCRSHTKFLLGFIKNKIAPVTIIRVISFWGGDESNTPNDLSIRNISQTAFRTAHKCCVVIRSQSRAMFFNTCILTLKSLRSFKLVFNLCGSVQDKRERGEKKTERGSDMVMGNTLNFPPCDFLNRNSKASRLSKLH